MKMTDDELIDAVLQAGDPFASTPEIAELDEVSISRRGLHKRLVSLADAGEISRKDVGQTTVWWVPHEDGDPVTADQVYTDGGVAQRVDRLDNGIRDLNDQVKKLEGGVQQFQSTLDKIDQDTSDIDRKVSAYEREYKGAVVSGAILSFAVVFALLEAIFGLPRIFDFIGGAALLGGLVANLYYLSKLLTVD